VSRPTGDEPPRENLRLEPHLLMEDLARDAAAIDATGARLGQAIKAHEGVRIDQQSGEVTYGAKLAWQMLLDKYLVEVEQEMVDDARDPDNKAPAPVKNRAWKVLEAEARSRAIRKHTQEYMRYVEAEAEVDALRKWLDAKERSSSIRQSLLKAQQLEAGLPQGRGGNG
jgi:hypothetical protein